MKTTLILILALFPALAKAESIYGDVNFLNGWRLSDGSYQTAIEFDLKSGWKTYWRVPGPSGIPPQLDWTGSSNIANITIQWPTPEVFDSAGYLAIGYKGRVVLPVRITPQNPNQPVNIFLQMDFGVCSDICVPASIDFVNSLDANTPVQGKADIRAALASTPLTAKAGGVRQASCALNINENGFDIEAKLRFSNPQSGNQMTIIEYPDPDYWVDMAETNTNGRNLTASTTMEYYGSGMMSLNRDNIRITVLDGSRAIEIQGCPAKG